MKGKTEKLLRWALFAGAALGIAFLLARFYGLKTLPLILLTAGALPTLLQGLWRHRKRQRAAERFSALGNFMEQMLYLFRRRPRLEQALREVKETADEILQPCIEQLLEELSKAEEEGACDLAIERFCGANPCRELEEMFRFFRKVEQTGGDYSQGLDILLDQIRSFVHCEELYQKELDHVRSRVNICLLLSVLIGAVSVKLIPEQFSIRELGIYQGMTTGILLLFMGVFLAVDRAFSRPWGRGRKPMPEAEVRRLKVLLQKPRGRKNWALLPGVIALGALCRYLGSVPGLIGCGVLALVLLTQDRRRRRSALKRLRREAEAQFPDWLRDLSIHLQTQTVQTALWELKREARPIMKVYLEQLLEEIDEDPVHITPYRNFMKELELPRVRDAMVLLYSLNGVGRQYAREQMDALSRKNGELYRQSEEIRRRDAAAYSGFTAAIPMGITVVKLMTDMALTLGQFLRSY